MADPTVQDVFRTLNKRGYFINLVCAFVRDADLTKDENQEIYEALLGLAPHVGALAELPAPEPAKETAESLRVRQCDREAAAELIEQYWMGAGRVHDDMRKLAQSYRDGHRQGVWAVAFAKHRTLGRRDGIEEAAQAAYAWWDGEPEDAEELRTHIRALGNKD